jgi:putative ABC transport system permease protein
MLSFLIALALIGLVIPLFNQLVGKEYSMTALANPNVILGIVLLLSVITLLAGYYPALVMSGMRPADVLKGNLKSSQSGIQLRRVLVITQFIISASLIICTLVVIDQLDYMQNRDLGFSGHQVLVLDMDRVSDGGASGTFKSVAHDVFKNELSQFPNIESVSFTNAVPGRPGWVGQWAFAVDKPDQGSIGTEYMTIDEDYMKTLGLTLIAGRNFEINRISEIEDGLIINEAAVARFGWESAEDAIGKRIDSPSKHPAGEVIGVVRDYHEFGLQQEIYPMAMDYNPSRSRFFAIRFKTTGTADLITNLEKVWKKYFDGYEFKYFFLDENFASQYQSEQKLAKVFTTFSIVTILIASIGLIGLVSFMVVSKTKEIGIRKILGAGIFNITKMLSWEFMILTLIANVIACPLAWYFMNSWLAKFAYRTTISLQLFVFTFAIGLVATFLTVSFQTIRAAMADPVKSLRYE